MKESEEIRIEAQNDTSDNLFRDVNFLRKIERAERFEKFESEILPQIAQKYPTDKIAHGFVINTDHKGKVTFYPKSNSLLIHNNNYWVKGYGLRWMNKYL